MPATDSFLDTNIFIYLFSSDRAKANRAEDVVRAGGTISVQVLNELAAVTTRRFGFSVSEIREVVLTVRRACRVVPLTDRTHDLGLDIRERFGFAVYDSMLLAAATMAGCSRFVSEDMSHGQRIGALEIKNPFIDMA